MAAATGQPCEKPLTAAHVHFVVSRCDMGFPNSLHIRGFVQGKVVRDIEQRESGEIFIIFEDGESLRLWATAKQPKVPDVEVIATPFQANGLVKQSVDIECSGVSC